MERFETGILAGEAAFTGDVDDQQDATPILVDRLGLSVDGCDLEVVNAHVLPRILATEVLYCYVPL
jgi:hypothetical protein